MIEPATPRAVPQCGGHLLSADFQYTHSTKTDVAKTWARFGWTPPDRERQRQTMLRLNPLLTEEEACQTH